MTSRGCEMDEDKLQAAKQPWIDAMARHEQARLRQPERPSAPAASDADEPTELRPPPEHAEKDYHWLEVVDGDRDRADPEVWFWRRRKGSWAKHGTWTDYLPAEMSRLGYRYLGPAEWREPTSGERSLIAELRQQVRNLEQARKAAEDEAANVRAAAKVVLSAQPPLRGFTPHDAAQAFGAVLPSDLPTYPSCPHCGDRVMPTAAGGPVCVKNCEARLSGLQPQPRPGQITFGSLTDRVVQIPVDKTRGALQQLHDLQVMCANYRAAMLAMDTAPSEAEPGTDPLAGMTMAELVRERDRDLEAGRVTEAGRIDREIARRVSAATEQLSAGGGADIARRALEGEG